MPTRRSLRTPLALACAAAWSAACGGSDKALVESTRRAVNEMDRARREALARADVEPREDLGPCPRHFKPILLSEGAKPGQGKEVVGFHNVGPYDPKRGADLLANLPDEMLASERLGIASASEVAIKPGPRAFNFQFKTRTDPGTTPPLPNELERLADPKIGSPDFELVIDAEVPPKALTKGEFEPGLLRGRFYVWSDAERAIVCAARVLVMSSERLLVKYQGPRGTEVEGLDRARDSSLLGDLRQEAIAQAAERLFVAGPPREGAEGGGAAGAAPKGEAGGGGTAPGGAAGARSKGGAGAGGKSAR